MFVFFNFLSSFKLPYKSLTTWNFNRAARSANNNESRCTPRLNSYSISVEFVNDIRRFISGAEPYHYADDTVIVMRHINYEDAAPLPLSMQCAATTVMNWFQRNLININVNNTKRISTNQSISLYCKLETHTEGGKKRAPPVRFCFHIPLKYVRLDFSIILDHTKCYLADASI